MNDSPQFMTVKQFADAAKFSVYTVYRMIEAGQIPHKRIGKSIRIPAQYLATTSEVSNES